MSTEINLPDGVAQIVVSNGTVIANISSGLLSRGLSLGIGDDQLRFQQMEEDDEDLPRQLVEFRPRFNPDKLVEMVAPAEKEPHRCVLLRYP